MFESQDAVGVAGWFWLRVTPEVAGRLSAGAAGICQLDWDWRIRFQDGALTPGKIVLAVVRRPKFLHLIDLFIAMLECPHNTVVWLFPE